MRSKQKSKESAAKSGILAGGILVAIELTTGILTSSLGLISSALNTIMDFTAATIAFFAVRKAAKPPDVEHHYGHEKIEALAGLMEIILLFVVCGWIVYEAVLRLATASGRIEMWPLAFGVNFVSIIIDSYAFLRLKRSGREHVSIALEAGSLHFFVDALIAAIVLVGLGLYQLLDLKLADSVAAIFVVSIVLLSSKNLLGKTTGILLDRAPRNIIELVRKEVTSVEGVVSCHDLRIRESGARVFADMHLELDRKLSLDRAHAITSAVEQKVRDVCSGCDIVIHTEPASAGEEDLVKGIVNRSLDIKEVKGIHDIEVHSISGRLFIEYHLELETALPLEEAHEIADRLEQQLKSEISGVEGIITHLEPAKEAAPLVPRNIPNLTEFYKELQRVAESVQGVLHCHDISLTMEKEEYHITMHCTMNKDLSLGIAHGLATEVENQIEKRFKRIGHVAVHVEPSS